MGPPSSLSTSQRDALRALTDGFLPPLSVPQEYQPKNEAQNRIHEEYWSRRVSADSDFLKALESSIVDKLPARESFLTRFLLKALSTSVGTALLFGKPTLHPFTEWPVPQQTALLQSLKTSSIATRRQIFNGFKRLICGLAYSYTVNGTNPFWKAVGYPGPAQNTLLSKREDTALVAKTMEQQRPIREALVPIDLDTEYECDIVIVGSGSGGSVAASVLSEAGYQVLVLEKGTYIAPADISNEEADALDRMYETHGLLTTKDGSMMILAGATLGGGTTINWSCCLPLPSYVREEWRSEHGLVDDFKEGGEFETSTREILSLMGVTNKITHNALNQKLQQGCDALGYEWEANYVNLLQTAKATAGYICFGDRYGMKRGALSVFLPKAISYGAKLIEGCHVEQVILGEGENGRRRAEGVRCRVGAHRLHVVARKAVVVAAGALHTPCLLRRSGLNNSHIGKHLRLHPVTVAAGFSKPTDPIECYQGAPLTTVCNQFSHGPANDGYGAKIECPSAHLGLLAAGLPWTNPEQFKDRMLRIRNGVVFIIVQRDKGEGTVSLARDGATPVVEYSVCPADKVSMQQAVCGGVRICIASESTEVTTAHSLDEGMHISDGDFLQEYLSKFTALGLKENEVALFSAHQMGSCRLSATPLSGALDPNGEVWESDDLYVMDASTFPTASGANPMITVMAISLMLSNRLALRLQHVDYKLRRAGDIQKAEEMAKRRLELRNTFSISPEKNSSAERPGAHWNRIVDKSLSILILLTLMIPILRSWFFDVPLVQDLVKHPIM